MAQFFSADGAAGHLALLGAFVATFQPTLTCDGAGSRSSSPRDAK